MGNGHCWPRPWDEAAIKFDRTAGWGGGSIDEVGWRGLLAKTAQGAFVSGGAYYFALLSFPSSWKSQRQLYKISFIMRKSGRLWLVFVCVCVRVIFATLTKAEHHAGSGVYCACMRFCRECEWCALELVVQLCCCSQRGAENIFSSKRFLYGLESTVFLSAKKNKNLPGRRPRCTLYLHLL